MVVLKGSIQVSPQIGWRTLTPPPQLRESAQWTAV